ncbi:MAG: DUF2079 domain-containing protein [Tychonema bourrellyi B0820]|uniref:DUF2079 domain-containing protein n=1 Tax=Tychonema bourrellyi FEM_GT703 TaxID=2040638 RepID=A0A2G4F4H6_9CYAN|nr:DUF2079 domain-containing protein [Tychonema bourrellyi]MDQ2099042.1 DUF2079 domain-containing protein [Tychonema bourrellyi B0820]PHX56611.1 DUF2079 domain-containing protein [Tychonema bourrellyi FEM_GT703]
MIVVTTIVLFAASSARHALFHSTAYDLAIFDQAIYLISQNQTPFSSLMAINILGDHTAFIFYPLALLYKIYPDVHWLLFVQAISLALGAWPSWSLARQAGLNEQKSIAVAAVYLLYPVVFNVNLFDFHPEVIALPAILAAILAARLDKIFWFCAAIGLIISCKAVLSLTVMMMGVWLLIFEKKRNYGLIAIFFGVAWFLIATQVIVPYFNQGKQHAGVGRYQYLGKSVFEIAINLVVKPQLIAGRVFSADTFGYLILLFLPLIWWLSPRHLSPLIGALPVLVMNILSDIEAQRDLIHQYSVPIFPFLLAAVIATLADRQKRGINSGKKDEKIGGFSTYLVLANSQVSKLLILWAILTFLVLAKYGYFWTVYLESMDTWQATRQAIYLVQTKGSVLTDNSLATHLAHRSKIKLLHQVSTEQDLREFDYVLLNLRHPWPDTKQTAISVVAQLKKSPLFKISYEKDDVLLFQKYAIK